MYIIYIHNIPNIYTVFLPCCFPRDSHHVTQEKDISFTIVTYKLVHVDRYLKIRVLFYKENLMTFATVGEAKSKSKREYRTAKYTSSKEN